MMKDIQIKDKKKTLEKILKDYKKTLSILKDKQDQLFIEGKLKEQIED
jgi:hypothetical protein